MATKNIMVCDHCTNEIQTGLVLEPSEKSIKMYTDRDGDVIIEANGKKHIMGMHSCRDFCNQNCFFNFFINILDSLK